MSSTLEPTFYGYVASSQDALLIFEAARGNQILQKVNRRPHDREREKLIKSGNIFVFDEGSSGIKRWTDGIAWSPSRILGNYLIYRQLERPLQPGEKKKAQKNRLSLEGRPGSAHVEDSPTGMKKELSPGESPSPREAGGPIRSHSRKTKHESSSNASDNGSNVDPDMKWSAEAEKELAGSLTDSYGFKQNGLIKKTISVEYEGTIHHLVSYYTIADVMLSRLPSPNTDPRIRDLVIGGDLLTRANFRIHPSSEAGNTSATGSPTQKRIQMPMHNQRRAEDPRHASGYGPMGYNGPPPPVHGGAPPPDSYADPNSHYGYGGPQPHYQSHYFPPQPPSYQVPMFMHGGPPPPRMVNPPPPYYGQPQSHPQYPPGPPPQHPNEVKREAPPPPTPPYYGAYQPYPQNQSTAQPMYQSHYPPRGLPPAQPPPQQPMNRGPYESSYQSQNTPQSDNRPPPPPSNQQRYDAPPPQTTSTAPGGSSPHHQPAAPPPPPTTTAASTLPPPSQPGQQPGQPLSRHNSNGPPGSPAPAPQSQESFAWNWSQSQPSQQAAQTRA